MTGNSESSAAIAQLCAKVLDDNKLEDIKIFDVVGALQLTDYFVVATGLNPRHLKAAADELSRKLRDARVRLRGVEGYRDARWILVDVSDVVVHLFVGESREFYDLDNLWGDCPLLAWSSRGARAAASGHGKVEGR